MEKLIHKFFFIPLLACAVSAAADLSTANNFTTLLKILPPHMEWTPDSRQIVFEINGKLFIYDTEKQTTKKLINDEQYDIIADNFSISPDGKWIATAASDVHDHRSLYIVPIKENAKPICFHNLSQWFNGQYIWSSDGNKLICTYSVHTDSNYENDIFYICVYSFNKTDNEDKPNITRAERKIDKIFGLGNLYYNKRIDDTLYLFKWSKNPDSTAEYNILDSIHAFNINDLSTTKVLDINKQVYWGYLVMSPDGKRLLINKKIYEIKTDGALSYLREIEFDTRITSIEWLNGHDKLLLRTGADKKLTWMTLDEKGGEIKTVFSQHVIKDHYEYTYMRACKNNEKILVHKDKKIDDKQEINEVEAYITNTDFSKKSKSVKFTDTAYKSGWIVSPDQTKIALITTDNNRPIKNYELKIISIPAIEPKSD